MKTPKWWLFLALGLASGAVLCLIVFMLLVWPPGALLVVALTLAAVAVLIDVPRGSRPPRAPR